MGGSGSTKLEEKNSGVSTQLFGGALQGKRMQIEERVSAGAPVTQEGPGRRDTGAGRCPADERGGGSPPIRGWGRYELPLLWKRNSGCGRTRS